MIENAQKKTNAKAQDLPKIFHNKWLEGSVENYNILYKRIQKIADKIGVKIIDAKNELRQDASIFYYYIKF